MRRRLLMTLDETIASRPLIENRYGAFCQVCQAPSDSELLVAQYRGPEKNEAHYRVRCHGDEEIGIFEFGSSEWDIGDVKRARDRRKWFDPSGLGNRLNKGAVDGR